MVSTRSMGTGKKKAAKAAKAGKAAKKAHKTKSLQHIGGPGGNHLPNLAKVDKIINKAEQKRRDKAARTAAEWHIPPPPNLVAQIQRPKSKYHSYFEFAENTDKKKKLEYEVTNDPRPRPGFKYIPIGNPRLSNKCKELSREQGAMYLIVSLQMNRDMLSRVSEHIHRAGYQFREAIVDEAISALQALGETVITTWNGTGVIEPIPETQEEINKQADGALRDLFPRIPNTDRQMIIDHAFQKGTLFHGEPVVGLSPELPLYRRVQLAVLAHIRHNHTRYDQLLQETSWVNARKVVEPVCLDFLVKWRGDEETGRDQLDEILREVVVLSDSEDSQDDTSDDDISDEEGELSSSGSEDISLQNSRPQLDGSAGGYQITPRAAVFADVSRSAYPTLPKRNNLPPPEMRRVNREQRGFSRYQAAWDQAVDRQEHTSGHAPLDGPSNNNFHSSPLPPRHDTHYNIQSGPVSRQPGPSYEKQAYHQGGSMLATKPDCRNSQQNSGSGPSTYRNEVKVRPGPESYMRHRESLSPPESPRMEQRPSQVVRGSPSNGLKDMLVPSIEVPHSSEAQRGEFHHDVQQIVYSGLEKEPHPRHVNERRRHSPPTRQVIVIDDSPPQVKRRRVVYEDDSGRFRPLPSSSRTAPSTDSHLIPVSSVHPRDFLVQQPRMAFQSGQGLFRDTQPSSGDITMKQRLPVYDARPEDFVYFDSNHGQSRRTEPPMDYAPQWGEPRHMSKKAASPRLLPERASEAPHLRQPHIQQMRIEDRDGVIRQDESHFRQGSRMQGHASPAIPVEIRASRSNQMGQARVVPDQTFIHNFSQSRIDSPRPRASNGFAPPGVSHQGPVHPTNLLQPYVGYSDRSSTSIHRAQDPLLVRYLERTTSDSRHYQGEQGRHASYDRIPRECNRSNSLSRAPPPLDDAPTHFREPGRQVIVLE